MLTVLILALALSMDACAVSIGLGAAEKGKPYKVAALAALAAVYFGVFQGVMPLVGYVASHAVLGLSFMANISQYTKWVAFALLLLIGLKMLYEYFSPQQEAQELVDEHSIHTANPQTNHKNFIILAVATSIDAMAAGFALNLMPLSPWISCLIIALVTGIMSYAGVLVGHASGTKLEDKAELLGGIILVLMAFKMLI